MRIIAGKYKGITLEEFQADNIRPTTDRVRENIFNKIQFIVADSNVLDLFCGTGAVSLEFLSRGASQVVSADNNSNSIKLINENFKKAQEKPNLIKKDYKVVLESLKGEKFDFIFLDPPYHTNYGEDSINLISKYDLLASDGMIIYEHLNDKQFSIPSDYYIDDTKKYGTISVTFLKKVNND